MKWRSRSSYLRLSSVALAGLLCGCKFGPDYKRPQVDAPKEFRGPTTKSASPSATQPSFGDIAWWDAFQDPVLQELIRTTLKNNYNLQIAVARVQQASAQRQQVASQLAPQVGYNTTAAKGRDSTLGSPRPPTEVNVPKVGTVQGNAYNESYLALLSVAWEVDLWGRIRRQTESAEAQEQAFEESRRDIGVSLISNVALTYFQLIELDRELQIAKSSVDGFQQSLNLFKQKYDAGASSLLDVNRAEATLESAAAQVPQIELQIVLKEDQLCVLLGENPKPILHKAGLDSVVAPEIPIGLPSNLLERRPDIRQAEQQIRAANAQVGVAIAEFFPKIGLSAFYGGASTDLSELTSRSNVTHSLTADISGPIFTGGGLVANKRQAESIWRQAVLQYQQTALTAFREVADALNSRQKFGEAIVRQKRATDVAQQSVTLAVDRYQNGKSSYTEVLDAQTQLYSAQSDLAKLQFNQLSAFVQLYAALGGGWSATDKPIPTTLPTTQAAQ